MTDFLSNRTIYWSILCGIEPPVREMAGMGRRLNAIETLEMVS